MASYKLLKEEGNKHYRNGMFEEALTYYGQALEKCDRYTDEGAIIHNNMAACHLQMKNYTLTIEEASKSEYQLLQIN